MSTRTRAKSPRQASDNVSYYAIDGVEDIGCYCSGGYHPVNIGDKFRKEQYRVLHKLGHGSYSTVWLARDERSRRLVALKVCTADTSERDAKVLSSLGGTPNDQKTDITPGKEHIPVLLDTFRVEGPHGTHTCLITDVASCTLDEARRRSWGRPLQLHVARAMVTQLLFAVSYMHKKGYVHGDLHVGNILIQHPKKLQLSDEETYEAFGEPEFEAVETIDGTPIPRHVPTLAVLPMGFPVKTNELALQEAHILLGDFGEAYQPWEEQRLNCCTPVHCRPPENFFRPSQPHSFPSDVWTLACTIWGVIGQRSLFESFMPTEDFTTAMQVEVLGRLPPEWWSQWEHRSRYFTADGQILDKDRPTWDWDFHFENAIQDARRGRGMELMTSEERVALLAMLKPMLAYEPEDRIAVGEVLRSKWVKDWAMADYKKLQERGQDLDR